MHAYVCLCAHACVCTNVCVVWSEVNLRCGYESGYTPYYWDGLSLGENLSDQFRLACYTHRTRIARFCNHTHLFSCGFWGLNSYPHVCTENALQTKLSASWNLNIFKNHPEWFGCRPKEVLSKKYCPALSSDLCADPSASPPGLMTPSVHLRLAVSTSTS